MFNSRNRTTMLYPSQEDIIESYFYQYIEPFLDDFLKNFKKNSDHYKTACVILHCAVTVKPSKYILLVDHYYPGEEELAKALCLINAVSFGDIPDGYLLKMHVMNKKIFVMSSDVEKMIGQYLASFIKKWLKENVSNLDVLVKTTKPVIEESYIPKLHIAG